MMNQLWPLARIGAFSLLVIQRIRSSASALLGANFGTLKPQPPQKFLAPAGPAGGSAISALPGAYLGALPRETSQKNGHCRAEHFAARLSRQVGHEDPHEAVTLQSFQRARD